MNARPVARALRGYGGRTRPAPSPARDAKGHVVVYPDGKPVLLTRYQRRHP